MKVPLIILACLFASCKAQIWKRLPGIAIDISAKGNEVWVINSAQQIFRWEGSDWKHIEGFAVQVGASPDGWTWVVTKDDQIFRWNVDNRVWDRMPGALAQISAMSKDRGNFPSFK